MLLECCRELAQTAHPQLEVGGPVRLVERPPSSGDGTAEVVGRGVGRHPDHCFGGRVHVVVDLAALGLDELAVDVEALFVPHARHGQGHRGSPSVVMQGAGISASSMSAVSHEHGPLSIRVHVIPDRLRGRAGPGSGRHRRQDLASPRHDLPADGPAVTDRRRGSPGWRCRRGDPRPGPARRPIDGWRRRCRRHRDRRGVRRARLRNC